MNTKKTPLRAALVAGITVTLTAGLLAVTAPAGVAEESKGTVKITATDGTRNRAQVTCSFDVLARGFRDGKIGSFAFFAVPPSGRHVALLAQPGQALTPSPARFAFTEADLNLPSTDVVLGERGYHIKFVLRLPNGTKKSKVFWLQPCVV